MGGGGGGGGGEVGYGGVASIEKIPNLESFTK